MRNVYVCPRERERYWVDLTKLFLPRKKLSALIEKFTFQFLQQLTLREN